MLQIALSTLLVSIVVVISFSQKRHERQYPAYIYAAGCVAHFLLFQGMKVYEVDYYWSLDYIAAGFISFLIIILIQRLSEYGLFHRRLQYIALASIVINALGIATQYMELSLVYYQTFASILYLILIRELLRNGRRHILLPRDDGIFRHLRHPTI